MPLGLLQLLLLSLTFALLIPAFAASTAPMESEHGKRDVITLVLLQVE